MNSPYTVGNRPEGIATEDFNGDGVPDLVVVNYCGNDPKCGNPGTITVLLGNGDGTFTEAMNSPYTVGNGPFEVVVADFDGNGIPDLAVANSLSGTVSVLLGNGDGTFQMQQTSSTVGSPYRLVVADFDGDSKPDIAETNQNNGTVGVLLGDGTGAFTLKSSPAVGNSPVGIVAAYLDADGSVDLAVANSGDSTVSVLLGNGDGTFRTQKTYNVGPGPQEVATADFNGDGFADLVVTSFFGDAVTVVLGDGTGNFGTPQSYSLAFPQGIAVGYFNSDGVPDLAITNNGNNGGFVLLGGAATMGTLTNIFVPGSGQQQINATYSPNPDFYTGSMGSVILPGIAGFHHDHPGGDRQRPCGFARRNCSPLSHAGTECHGDAWNPRRCAGDRIGEFPRRQHRAGNGSDYDRQPGQWRSQLHPSSRCGLPLAAGRLFRR